MATTSGRRLEIKTLKFLWAVISEFIATAIFIFITLGSSFKWPSEQPSVLQITLAFGLTMVTLVQVFGQISGAHVNPAVTIAYFVGNQISIIRLVFYLVLQLLGALAGAGIIYVVTPKDIRKSLSVNHIAHEISSGEALVVEMILTFAVVMCIFSANDKRTNCRNNSAVTIGLAVSSAHLIGIYYTGCSINPARSFAPAAILGTFTQQHWVFWVGPILGAILAAIFYNYLLCPQCLSREERLDIFKGYIITETQQQYTPGTRTETEWNSESEELCYLGV